MGHLSYLVPEEEQRLGSAVAVEACREILQEDLPGKARLVQGRCTHRQHLGMNTEDTTHGKLNST